VLRYDLHCHSTHSDGLLTPTALVQRAASRGVDVLALTDHDEVSGLSEAQAAERSISAVERLRADIGVPNRLRELGVRP